MYVVGSFIGINVVDVNDYLIQFVQCKYIPKTFKFTFYSGFLITLCLSGTFFFIVPHTFAFVTTNTCFQNLNYAHSSSSILRRSFLRMRAHSRKKRNNLCLEISAASARARKIRVTSRSNSRQAYSTGVPRVVTRSMTRNK